MKSVPAVWKEKYVVRSYEVDVRKRVKPHVIFSYLLDSAWNHALSSEFNYEDLSNRGQFWALARFLMVFDQFPEWNESVVVETWGKDIDRFYALRDFTIHSTMCKKFAAATSSWLILDRNTYRPQKLERLREKFPFQFGKHELDVKLGKIPAPVHEIEHSRDVVHFTDIDVNKHVNASKYVQWIIDSFHVDVSVTRDLKSFEINFISEAKLDDEIIVSVESAQNQDLCTIKRAADDRELCRARLIWS
jgi:medium-chain acyl-[acyl-carrier-protein] hydrolase